MWNELKIAVHRFECVSSDVFVNLIESSDPNDVECELQFQAFARALAVYAEVKLLDGFLLMPWLSTKLFT